MSELDDILLESVKEVERKTYSGVGVDHEKVISNYVLTDGAKQQIKALFKDFVLSVDKRAHDKSTVTQLAELSGRKEAIIELLQKADEL